MIFKATVPILPPGINHSFQIVKHGNSYTLAASPELKAFKEQCAEFLSFGLGIEIADWDTIHKIASAREKTHLIASISFYFTTLWKRDLDGGEKHVVDAIFAFFKVNGCQINDTCIVRKITEKNADRDNTRFEMSLSIRQGVES